MNQPPFQWMLPRVSDLHPSNAAIVMHLTPPLIGVIPGLQVTVDDY